MKTVPYSVTPLRRKTLVLGLGAALALGAVPLVGGSPAGAQRPLARARIGALQLAPGLARASAAAFRVRSSGNTLSVDNCNDAGPGSLRDAVAAAADGDTLDLTGLACSTITLATGQITVPQPNLTIVGRGSAELTIDAAGLDRAFYLSSKYADSQTAIHLLGLTIANGKAFTNGGCIKAQGNLMLGNVQVRNCTAGDDSVSGGIGGGISAIGNVGVSDSVVSGNVARGTLAEGGGIFSLRYVTSLNLRVDGNSAIAGSDGARGGGIMADGIAFANGSISHNTAQSTGGEALGGGVLAIGTYDVAHRMDAFVRTWFTAVAHNTAVSDHYRSYGGGIRIGAALSGTPSMGSANFMGSTISANQVLSGCAACTIGGGGVDAYDAIVAQYSTIRDNVAILGHNATGSATGGGMHASSATYGMIALGDSTISGNQATAPTGTGYGGGAATADSAIALYESTVANNTASTRAGGLSPGGTTYPVTGLWSSIVADNFAPVAADIGLPGTTPITIIGDNNLVVDVDPLITLPADTLNADPKLLPLANNGGATATHALAACSPAIDASDFAAPATYDQRYQPAYVRIYGAAQDIGAFELQPDPDRVFGDGFDGSPCP